MNPRSCLNCDYRRRISEISRCYRKLNTPIVKVTDCCPLWEMLKPEDVMSKSYRIITDHGTVDFAATEDVAFNKYTRYAADCRDGYCKFVRMVEVTMPSGKERTIVAMMGGEA